MLIGREVQPVIEEGAGTAQLVQRVVPADVYLKNVFEGMRKRSG